MYVWSYLALLSFKVTLASLGGVYVGHGSWLVRALVL